MLLVLLLKTSHLPGFSIFLALSGLRRALGHWKMLALLWKMSDVWDMIWNDHSNWDSGAFQTIGGASWTKHISTKTSHIEAARPNNPPISGFWDSGDLLVEQKLSVQ